MLELPILRLFYPTSIYKFNDVHDGNVIFYIGFVRCMKNMLFLANILFSSPEQLAHGELL